MLNKDSLDFLEKLLQTNSPSGFESQIQKLYTNRLKKYVDKIEVDNHGNCMTFLNYKAKTRIMLAGHCDEIGLMVMHVSDNGFLYVKSIGGTDKKVLPGSQVLIFGKNDLMISGVIGKKAIHLEESDDRKNAIKIEDMYVDIGVNSKKEALEIVEIGAPITITPNYKKLYNNNITSKALDDKVSIFIISEVMRNLSNKKINIGICGVSTVQEEIGSNGALVCSDYINAQAGIAIDVCFATDCPNDKQNTVGDTKLGKGPVIKLGSITSKKLNSYLIASANKLKKEYQVAAEPSDTGTDADAMQIDGMAVSVLSIPCRYMHTPVEVCSLIDIENAIDILTETLLNMSKKPNFIPYEI
jgi:tetrahedral aminopeptidase